MNSLIEKLLSLLKKPKVMLMIGFIGILIIFLSSVIPEAKDDKKISTPTQTITAKEYKTLTEDSIKQLVYRITGDKNAMVVITLDSGIKYSYANAKQTDSSKASAKESEQKSESISSSYVTVRTSDGGEEPLLITEYMPEVRGVAIICNNGDIDEISQKIKNAVTAALNITSKRVYIAGGYYDEKR